MRTRRLTHALSVLFIFGLALGTTGCGTTACEEKAIAACKEFLEETPGSGDRYNACFEKALAACGG